MSLIDAILWKWPGAQVVVSGGVLVRWDGPMPEPSPAEIDQAGADYESYLAMLETRRELPVPVPGRYLGLVAADPESPNDGDLWIVREAYPTQRRIERFRDGAVTRTLHTLVL